jgi:hypothetical protein
VRLARPEPAQRYQVIDTVTPTDEPVGPTDLIAEQNSKAHDVSDGEGKRQAPHFEKPSEFDLLAGPAPREKLPPAPSPQPQSGAQTTPKAQSEPDKAPKPPAKPAAPVPARVREVSDRAGEGKIEVALNEEAKPEGPEPAPSGMESPPATGPPGPFQAAAAGMVPGSPDLPVGESRGRVDGGVKNDGFLGFEAMQSEIAPYLKEIRKRVERNWVSALEFRFSGSSPTKAVLDCAISPDGRLVSLIVVNPGNSVSYGPLCKEAIERAGPFPPFPFKVPDVYRSTNLEIRWTFSFLQ